MRTKDFPTRSGVKDRYSGPAFGKSFPRRERSGWSVPWSDLMMVMFILFLILFVYSTGWKTIPPDFTFFSGQTAGISSGRSSDGVSSMQLHLEGIYARLQEKVPESPTVIRISHHPDRGILITLNGEAFFSPGRGELKDSSYHYLAQIAEILTMVRSQIVVAGFSNLQGTHQDGPSGASPWEVSAMRAVQVTSYFTEKKGLAPYQFLVQGHGSARPLVPDTSKESHARNERVEITITNQPV